MMEYFVAQDNEVTDFQEIVTELLREGWQLYGNLVITIEYDNDEVDTWYYQAMVRNQEPTYSQPFRDDALTTED